MPPDRHAEMVALGQDPSLANELAAARLVLGRLLDAMDDASDDRRLAQGVASLCNVIVRIIQTQSRLDNPASELDDEIARALDELDAQEVTRDRHDPHTPTRPCPPRSPARAAAPARRSRSGKRLRSRHPPDGRRPRP